jgi:4-hydroxy-tetrahydrodipicolinate synthase
MNQQSPENKSDNVARGVYAAALTPFTKKLTPDCGKFVDHCRWLLANGCDGLAPFGTTGEGPSLGVGQKIELIEAAHSAALPMHRMIAGTGVCALQDAVRLARMAVKYNCEGILCLPPFYYKNPDENGLFEFYSQLVENVGDARLRIFLYHFPNMSAIPISTSLVERLITRYPETIAGLKDSSGDWRNTSLLLESFPGFKVFSGSEQFLLDNLNAGGAGCISATTNLAAMQAQGVFTAWLNADGNEADLQLELSATRLALQAFPMVPMLKAAKARQSGDTAWLRMLPPLVKLTEQLDEKLDLLLRQLQYHK